MKNSNFKIVIIIGDLGIGGAEKQLIYYLRSLIHLSFDVHAVCICEVGKNLDRIKNLKINYSIINDTSILIRFIKLYQILISINPKIIHCWHFFTAAYTYLYSFFSRSIILGSFRSDGKTELNTNSFLLYFILRSPKYFISNSRNAIKNIKEIFNIKSLKLKYLSNVIDLSNFKNDIQTPEKYCVINISNLLEIKRLDLFIKSINEVRKEFKDIRAIIVGDGPERENLKKLINSLDLTKNIKLLGSRDDISYLISRSKICVLTSRSEGSSNVVLEYMASSKPVISTNVGDCNYIIENNRSGYILESNNLTLELSEKIKYLLSNEKIRIQMGNVSREIIEENYSYTLLEDSIVKLYNEINLL